MMNITNSNNMYCLIMLIYNTVVLCTAATFLAMQCNEVQHATSASVHLSHLNGSTYQILLCTKWQGVFLVSWGQISHPKYRGSPQRLH